MKLISTYGKRIGLLVLAAAAMGATTDGGTVPERLIGMALSGGKALSIAESLTDNVGPRPSGSAGAAHAVTWAVEQMKALGFKNVHTEPVKVPHWVRGEAEADVVAPTAQRLRLAALGPSVATPPDGLTAEVVEVWSFDELKALGGGARGKIVLFNHHMKASRTFEEYAKAVALRGHGAVEAARAGAVAMLVRSAGSGEMRLAHAGGMRYDPAVPKIPAAALAAEDADLLHRLLQHGKVRVRLKLTSHLERDVESANVVGEVPGRERPDEVVLLGAHLDSWDLATGALDDAAGCAVVMDAARLIAHAGRAPKRTVRVVLFMNEEMGLSGAIAYAKRHAAELPRHVAALEVDSGAGRPSGFGAVGGARAVALLRKLAAPLGTVGAAEVTETDEAGADLIPMAGKVPELSIDQDLMRYFDWHHTAADTFDKIDPLDLALNTAAVAVVAYGLADSTEMLPIGVPSHHGAPPPATPRMPNTK